MSVIKPDLEVFRQKRIVVLGDVMLDSYRFGRSNRISPEAPVPVLDLEKKEDRPGGAANVAMNLKGLGAEVFLCSVTGMDEGGTKILQLCMEGGINTDAVIQIKNRKTTVKTRLIAHGHHLLRVDEEQTDLITQKSQDKLFLALELLFEKHKPDALLFEDYDKGLLSEDFINKCIDLSRQKGIFTSVDPKKRNFLSYRKVDLFKPNLRELCDGLHTQVSPNDTESIKVILEALRTQLNHHSTLLTLSEAGVIFESSAGTILYPAIERKIADVSGAGDTVIAVATLAFASGFSASWSVWLANLAGGFVCERPGVYAIQLSDLAEQLELHPLPEKS